jgi:hypothetical protein
MNLESDIEVSQKITSSILFDLIFGGHGFQQLPDSTGIL